MASRDPPLSRHRSPPSSSLASAMFPYPNDLEMHGLSSSFFPFSPSTFHHHDCLHELLLSPAAAAAPPAADLSGCERHRRSSGKDRHSKICTAQGPRDRRMRLSLDVARKFFDLQDLLGFDKASMTVQWLLTMSKSAIRELASASKSDASSSHNEEADFSPASDALAGGKPHAEAKDCRSSAAPRRPSLQSRAGRESREKARARARERTLEKKTRHHEHRGGEGKTNRPDLRSSPELPAAMNPDKNRSSSSSHDINLSDYNLHNAVGNYLFQDAWENMSFTSSCVDERFLLGEL